MLLRKLLISLGLAKAPTPVRLYAAMGGGVGLLPIAGYYAWKNRAKLAGLLGRARAATPRTFKASGVANGVPPVSRSDSYASTGL